MAGKTKKIDTLRKLPAELLDSMDKVEKEVENVEDVEIVGNLDVL